MSVKRLAIVAATAAALVLAGCGDDGDDGAGGDPHGDHGDHVMNDPHATPADELDGAELTTGAFVVLDSAPPRSDDVAGQAWLGQNDDGTTVTARLTGLTPGDDYMLHLHAQPCAEEDGGPHFMFDTAGEEVPPNEIHLAFTADGEGAGEATVTNDRQIGTDAPSIVIHPVDAMDNRIACADFA